MEQVHSKKSRYEHTAWELQFNSLVKLCMFIKIQL
uniref:Uncharacterized protein n=1 Tax=Arundo donax TaxID=35708 RepID=A0A0A9GXN8_ARUDO